MPEGKNWPVLVFVHGGGWDSGDRQYEVAGADIYANIGRFFAARGVGTAVISYRLYVQMVMTMSREEDGTARETPRDLPTAWGTPAVRFQQATSRAIKNPCATSCNG